MAGEINNRKKAKFVYAFGACTDGDASMREILGGKGANLAEMALIGLPVPPGFTLSTEVCGYFYANSGNYPRGLEVAVSKAISEVEKQQNKGFGDPVNPLLFSVRSGARESMPGMMDTILNLGLNDSTVQGLAERTQDARFAWDCYRRFIQMYGEVVMGVHSRGDGEPDPFQQQLAGLMSEQKIDKDDQLSHSDLQELVRRYKRVIKQRCKKTFPQDVHEQLWGAIAAVLNSWKNERAILYRQRYGIPVEWGTAVNVQAMVFGNLGQTSGTGVAFTRDPATGEKTFYGEYLLNAQGEDVVAGIRTPKAISLLAEEMPRSFAELKKIRSRLERHFRDMQDFEFTIEDGRLYMLQTRNGKRTGLAAVRIAVEMNRERLMDRKTALLKIPAESIDSLLVPVFDKKAQQDAHRIGHGLAAGPGAASGRIVFSAFEAEREARLGNKVILVREETSPDDLRGMLLAQGILTARGGVSSHAALVARQLGKVCVCGASELAIDYVARVLTIGGVMLKEGEYLSIDGSTGEIYAGMIETTDSEVQRVLKGRLAPEKSATFGLYQTVMDMADKVRRMKVRTNADTPGMAKTAIAFGAEGIGLCRTEHMFFDGNRIDLMRQMILAADVEERRAALKKLLPFQRRDFQGLFRAMEGRPVTIRLLDPPLHEFLPHDDARRAELAQSLNVSTEYIIERIKALHEENPMLGCRGCRLGILHPEITEMQVRAIFEAAVALQKSKRPVIVKPEIMVPLVGFDAELRDQVAIVRAVADEVLTKAGIEVPYQVGTMIEVPRAAITADEIAETAEFFSFGTNDLTQTTLGLSRDDMGSFFDVYRDKEIYGHNPFASIDEAGVGRLMRTAIRGGRDKRSNLKLGICGEHAGDASSIAFCEELGLDYVSCSPPRVPVARLAAAQAVLSGN